MTDRVDLSALADEAEAVTLPDGREVALRAPTMVTYALWRRTAEYARDPLTVDKPAPATIERALREILPDGDPASVLTWNEAQQFGLLAVACHRGDLVAQMIAAIHEASSSPGNAGPTTPSPEASPVSDSGPSTPS